MKKLEKTVLFLIIFGMLFNCSSCSKESNEQYSGTESIANQDKGPWWKIIVIAVTTIIVECTEGHYYEIQYSDNGHIIHEKGCKGLGHCALNGKNATNGTPLSSITDYGRIGDYAVKAVLGTTEKGEVILMLNSAENVSTFNRFFYDDIINISRPLIIDNEQIMKDLNLIEPIKIEGDYLVHKLTGNNGESINYIILNE